MVTGAATVLFWIYAPITVGGESLSSTIYEIVPGFIASTLAIVIVSKATLGVSSSMAIKFAQVEAKHKT